ncbi:MAG: choice-of-anchor D domain-containing protein [Planctomycetes bacterium]|nr:choice-of-anchor D domain-containing protein [Planctomycetota bacterium]
MAHGAGSRLTLLACLLAIALAAAAPWAAAAPFFQGLGDIPGGSFNSQVYGISSDGLVVAGWSESAYIFEAFRWTQAGGMVGLGDFPGGAPASMAFGANSDGSVVLGNGNQPLGYEAFRWTQVGGMVGIGDLPGGGAFLGSRAWAASSDGSVLAGEGTSDSGNEAFRWTQAGGMVGLGDLAGGSFNSAARGISSDGSVLVGYGNSASGREAFRWTQAGGMVGLGDLPGGSFESSAYGVSSDGSVVVGEGRSATSGGFYEAFRWTQAAGMVGLVDLAGGDFSSSAYAVSSDGSVVVGRSNSASGDEAFRWTAADGMRTVRDILVSDFGLGGSLGTWVLREARGVSGDGKVIVGSGRNPSGQWEGWIASMRVATLSSTPGNGGTLNFGNVLVGNSGTQSLSVSNTGDLYTTLAGNFPAAGGEFAPGSTQGFSLAQGAGTSRDYTYTPGARGSDSLAVTITSDGGISGQNATITFSGRGVAPQQQTVLLNNAGLVRIGTSGAAQIRVTNQGDGNLSGLGGVSNLRGDIALLAGSPPEFTGGTPVDLADGISQTYTYTYTPTAHGAQQATVRADFDNGSDDGRNLPQILDQLITGTGVGPVFASSTPPGATIDFGAVIIGGNALRPLAVSNATTDPNGGNPLLTALSLLTADITGPDALMFDIAGFTEGMVLNGGDPVSFFDISFSAQGPDGPKSAILTLTTDQGAAFGEEGATFTFNLTGTVFQFNAAIPEPATIALLLGGLAALARRRRKPTQQ